ncbi:MAG: primase-helicase zinc-binding domain-containing protein, partial [Thermoguttaceae bacterium]|nr:primase-helicase zinc-binding domain-containing protein [Thermoguttaceae bacterium]
MTRVLNGRVAQVKEVARGRWPEILIHVGHFPAEVLDGRHHPCPRCGGKDRFRLIDAEDGAVFCNQCFRRGNGDGLAAIQWYRGWTFPEVVSAIEDYLGLKPQAKTPRTTPQKAPSKEATSPPRQEKAYPSVAAAWAAIPEVFRFGREPDAYWGYTDEDGRVVMFVL